jgi:hypothetical protein
MMGNHPPWNEQTVEQKLAFVHEWLMNVDAAITSLRGQIQGLDDRLRRVESANVQLPREQTFDAEPS